MMLMSLDPSQTTGNKVSRQSVLCGSQNTILTGKNIVDAGAIIRGDLASIRTGRSVLCAMAHASHA